MSLENTTLSGCAACDLRGMENRLVVMCAVDGIRSFRLPESPEDDAAYYLLVGEDAGDQVFAMPFAPDVAARVEVVSDCAPGDWLYVVTEGNNAGKLDTITKPDGTVICRPAIARAEESAIVANGEIIPQCRAMLTPRLKYAPPEPEEDQTDG
ncbi:MAG: hypothetical protein EOM20_06765 [Spartobacteria bacterium]|nr:hypothetical protein [Spartobacteria bacterium]